MKIDKKGPRLAVVCLLVLFIPVSCQTMPTKPGVLVSTAAHTITSTSRSGVTKVSTTAIPTIISGPTLTATVSPTSALRIGSENVKQLQVVSKLEPVFPISEALSVAYSPDGDLLVSVNCIVSDVSECSSGVAIVWDIATEQPLTTLEVSGEPQRGVAFSPDGQYIASRGFGKLFLWDAVKLKLVKTVPMRLDAISSRGNLAFGPDGSILAYLDKSQDFELVLWDVTSQEIRTKLPVPGNLGISFAFSPDGKAVAIAACKEGTENYLCTQGQITLTDIASGRVIRTFNGDGGAVAFSPDGKYLAASVFEYFSLWDVTSQHSIFAVPNHSKSVGSVAFSLDGSLIVTGGHWPDKNLAIWDAADGHLLATWEYGVYVSSIAFSPDGKHIAVAESDGLILLGLP